MARRRRGENISGWVLLDKPEGLSSTSAVSRVRRIFNANKGGHAGTLDPLATGMLPIALGEATKTVPFIVDSKKTYQFTIEWGIETETDDCEGEVAFSSKDRPTQERVKEIVQHYQGEITQIPPAFSAIKIDGERAYDLARSGEKVDVPARQVTIFDITIKDFPDEDHCVLEVECSKGTYIRALARDIGRDLGCFGHVSQLRRLNVGCFLAENMISLDHLEKISHSAPGQDMLANYIHPVETALDDIPALAVGKMDEARLKQGQAVLIRGKDAPTLNGTAYAMSGNTLIALGEVEKGKLYPKRVFSISGP